MAEKVDQLVLNIWRFGAYDETKLKEQKQRGWQKVIFQLNIISVFHQSDAIRANEGVLKSAIVVKEERSAYMLVLINLGLYFLNKIKEPHFNPIRIILMQRLKSYLDYSLTRVINQTPSPYLFSETPQLQAPRFTTQPSSSGSIVSEGRTKILQCHALGMYSYVLLRIVGFLFQINSFTKQFYNFIREI